MTATTAATGLLTDPVFLEMVRGGAFAPAADWLTDSGRPDLGAWLVAETSAAIAALRLANGRRRERTVSADDLGRMIADVSEDGEGAVVVSEGGTVANAYGYRAVRTVGLAVRRTDGTVRLSFRTGSASKGASDFSPHGGGLSKRSSRVQFVAWADAVRPAVSLEGIR